MKTIYILVSFFIVVACTHSELNPKNQSVTSLELLSTRSPSSTETQLKTQADFAAYKTSDSDLSFNELKIILYRYRFSKIEDLLNYLQVAKPQFMARYTLLHRSKSLHDSSVTHPRALVFGESARFIITFNGDPSQKAFEMLEVTEFNSLTKKFEYREIEFNEFNQMTQPFKISDINGPGNKCLHCHTDSRPIWNAYDLWPGAFGSVDDIGVGKSVKSNHSGMIDFLGENFPQVATEKWKLFASQGLQKGRYRFLNPMAPSKVFNVVNTNYKTDYPATLRPNSDLSAALGLLNFERIGRILRQNLAGDPMRYALLFESSQCKRINREFYEALHLLIASFKKAARPRFLDQFIFEMSELAMDHDTNWKEIRDRANTDDYKNVQSESEFYKLLKKEYFLGYFYNNNANHLNLNERTAGFLSIIFHFVPKAKLETWPMQIYEGVYNFETGLSDSSFYFQHVLFQELFLPHEKDFLERLENATTLAGPPKFQKNDLEQVCSEIYKKIPKRFFVESKKLAQVAKAQDL